MRLGKGLVSRLGDAALHLVLKKFCLRFSNITFRYLLDKDLPEDIQSQASAVELFIRRWEWNCTGDRINDRFHCNCHLNVPHGFP